MEQRITNVASEICFGIAKLNPGEYYDVDEAEYEFVTGFADEVCIEDYFIFGEELWDKLLELDSSIVSFEESESTHIILPGNFETIEQAISWIESNTGFVYNPIMNEFCRGI